MPLRRRSAERMHPNRRSSPKSEKTVGTAPSGLAGTRAGCGVDSGGRRWEQRWGRSGKRPCTRERPVAVASPRTPEDERGVDTAIWFLTFAELRRAKLRFAMLTAAVALLMFLILFQQALQAGLITGFVGAIRNQSAPVLVYSVDGQRVFQASVIDEELEQLVRDAPEVDGVGRLSQTTVTVTAADELVDASIIGYERGDLGAPTTLVEGRLAETTGEAVAGIEDASSGFAIGDTVVVEPGGTTLTIVGLSRDAQLNVTATLFVGYDTFTETLAAQSAGGGVPPPNLLGVIPADGVRNDEAVAALNALDDRLEALTREDAADGTPGVDQVRQSFAVIFTLFAFVVPLVAGLFFLITTIQKTTTLTVLRAIGVGRARLVGALLIQVVVVTVAGVLVGTALFVPVVVADATSLALRFEVRTIATWAALVVALAVVSALIPARRIMAIDPNAATGRAGIEP